MAKTRILVVDDEISILKFVSASLRSAGYEPSLALDNPEALHHTEAKVAGKDLTIKRVGDEIYFWAKSQSEGSSKRRGRRPRKAGAATP